MSNIQDDLGAAIVARMKGVALFDDVLGGSGANLDVQYVQARRQQVVGGPQGRCTVFPASWTPTSPIPATGANHHVDIGFLIDFEFVDVLGLTRAVPLVEQALRLLFMDEDRAWVTETLVDTGNLLLGKSGEPRLTREPVPVALQGRFIASWSLELFGAWVKAAA
jgi:hypothetical protein